jgi:hypothetical protein
VHLCHYLVMSFEYPSPESDAGEYAEASWVADPDKYKELLEYIKLVSAMITHDSFPNLQIITRNAWMKQTGMLPKA